MIRLFLLLALFVGGLRAAGPVYVVLWFDTEDYVDPIADDAALRIATDLTQLGVRATFKVVGEKARVLDARGRTDVIRALSHHAIGYHSNWHSVPPPPSVYLRRMGFLEGAKEFERRERAGVADLRRIFGVDPICYGQPGSSWAPQTHLALRRMNIPVYLDDGTHVGVDDQPFWYGGLLNIFNIGVNATRAELDGGQKDADGQFDAIAKRLAAAGGGLISIYYHPTEFVHTQFWDAVNFLHGVLPERSQWKNPPRRTPEDAERCYRILHDYVAHAKTVEGVRFVTARDVLQLYEGPIAKRGDRRQFAEHLSRQITFLRTPQGNFSAADMLLELLGLDPQVVDGPTRRGLTTFSGSTIPRYLFERAKEDAVDFIRTNRRLPSEVFVGTEALSLADFAATVAGDILSPGAAIRLIPGNIEFERYFATDPQKPFSWPIHPKGFAAPELLDLARLQGWTLKPARLR